MGKRRRNFGVFVPVGLSVPMRSSSSCTFRLKSIVCAQRSRPCSLTSDTKPGGRSSACPGETAVSRLPRRHHRIATDGFWTSRVFCFVLWVVSLKKLFSRFFFACSSPRNLQGNASPVPRKQLFASLRRVRRIKQQQKNGRQITSFVHRCK